MYLLISIDIKRFEGYSTPSKDSCKELQDVFIKKTRLVLNGFIIPYQDFLNNLNLDTTYDITQHRKNEFIGFKVCHKPLILSLL